MPLNWGRVIASSGRRLVVQDEAGRRWSCHCRGRRLEAVVGDVVEWAASGDGGVVERVSPRRNLLMRQDQHRTKAFAANLDALLFVMAVQPTTSESLLTRALLAASDAGISVTLLLNKTDLPGTEDARSRLGPYRQMGYAVLEASVRRAPDQALDGLSPVLSGRTTLILGASGVGKSSLLNLLVPEALARTAEVSQALQSGRHTTTSTTWYALPGMSDTAIIDSPGFQAFGLNHLDARAVAAAMPDLAAWLGQCRFADCSHLHEPDCGVRTAVDRGEVTPARWRVYREILEELTPSSARRD